MSACVRLRVASECYAIPVEHALEVADLAEVAAIPGARPELLGVRNLRGQILPVVDLARLLRIPRSGPPGRLLVTQAGDLQAGLAVDEVCDVGELGDPTEETESELLLGATLTDGELVGVLDVPQVFASLQRPPP
ncbi:MAG TPA: chemotaxis protein CheW [Gaiellales bacterium]|nr:chemotaxis protein CheW [Gaiellales bacterium]